MAQTGTAISKVPEPLQPRSGGDKTSSEMCSRFFVFFLVSGFCGILYELIWLRLSMAEFGVTTAMTSIVISVFMSGLGIGSWAAGKLIARRKADGFPRIRIYALVEFLIGVGSLVVPYELQAGRRLLEAVGMSSSFGYYLAAASWLAIALIPWCVSMGATFPVAMWAMRSYQNADRARSFSYLYVANVLGALGGALLPLLLIEVLGFRGALRVGGILNLGLAIWAFALSYPNTTVAQPSVAAAPASEPVAPDRGPLNLSLLLATGLTSMGMEVLWIRIYTPYLGTVVYAFAAILGVYLLGTFFGSLWYRTRSPLGRDRSPLLWAIVAMAALLPLATSDPRVHFAFPTGNLLRVVVGIVPFTMLLGFLTPMLVDRVSGGDPDRAGKAYAVNVLGCIAGPLLTGFVLLPRAGERWSMGILASVWVLAGAYFAFRSSAPQISRPRTTQFVFAGSLLVSIALLVATQDFTSPIKDKVLLRDETATVAAVNFGGTKLLLMNGWPMTNLTPITKYMAHLPLAMLDQPPKHALVICFGMGTTYRSLLSWGIRADAAELVPSIPRLFPYFHADAAHLMQSPLGRIIVDDGRRYLERTTDTYDLITIDPPPPVPAAGSSLLYSKEFYSMAKRKLKPGGIVAQWLPGGDRAVQTAVARAIQESFAHVRVFVAIGGQGYHLLASDSPIRIRSARELADRMPESAKSDLVEWGPFSSVEEQFDQVLRNEIAVEELIRQAPSYPAMTDDRPVNEYYLLRLFAKH